MTGGVTPSQALQQATALSVAAACLVFMASASPYTAFTVFLAVLACLAVLRPVEALLIAVAFAPISRTAGGPLLGAPGAAVELLVLAIGSGVMLREAIVARRADNQGALIPLLGVLAAIVAASLIVELAATRVLLSPDLFWPTIRAAIGDYARSGRLNLAGPFAPLPAAAIFLTGLLLAAIVAMVRREPDAGVRVLRMFVIGAAAAGALNLVRVIGGALRSGTPVAALLELVRTVRVNVAYEDVNAAGSFFVLATFAAMGLAITDRGWRRGVFAGCAAVCGAALWLTGSRTAVLGGLGVLFLWTLWNGGRVLRWGLPALLIVGTLAFWTFPRRILDNNSLWAIQIRTELTRTAFRLLAEDPVFGVGIGRFYYESAGQILDPAVRAAYRHENAHNNFLQILAELGLAGFGCFLGVLWCAARAARSMRAELAGAALGLGAFLVTCLAGHPLLTADVAVAFWCVLALIAETSVSSPRGLRHLLPVALAVLAVTLPYRISREVRTVNLERVAYGLPDWETNAAGDSFRRMTDEVTMFVPSDATAIELPYRLVTGGGAVEIEVSFGGRPADRLLVASAEWRVYRATVLRSGSEPFIPLRLKVESGAASSVGLGRLVVRRGSDRQ
jgi:O-antigen ligase